MSALTELTTRFTAASGGGISDTVNNKVGDWEQTFLLVAGFGALALVVFFTLKGGFTVGKLIINLAVAGLFLAMINDLDFVRGLFSNEFN